MKRGREEMAGGVGGSPAAGGGKTLGKKDKPRGDPGKPSWLELVEDGRKRSRRPPPRFETATTTQEELIIRQAIENSIIETKLSADSVADIPEVPTYRYVFFFFFFFFGFFLFGSFHRSVAGWLWSCGRWP